MKFTAALIIAAAGIATAAPSVMAPPTEDCPAEYPLYGECTDAEKSACYPAGEPPAAPEDCTEEEFSHYYPKGAPKGHKGPGKKHDKPEEEEKPTCEAEKYPEYDACSEKQKQTCYPAGKPEKTYDDCTEDEEKTWYPHGPPKGYHKKDHGKKHDDKECKPEHYKPYEDCDEDTKKVCYPEKPGKPYDDCDEGEKGKWYPHGKPMKPVHYVTTTVKHYETYCPSSTVITYDHTKEYTATEHEYVTLTCDTGCGYESPVYEAPTAYETSAYEAVPTAYPTEEAAPTAYPTADAASPTYPVVAGAAKVGGAGLAAVAGVLALVF